MLLSPQLDNLILIRLGMAMQETCLTVLGWANAQSIMHILF